MTPYYQDQFATLFLGDCREILPTLPKMDCVVTDPPYGVGFRYETYEDSAESFNATVLHVVREAAAGTAAVFMSMRQMHLLPKPRWALCWHKPGSIRRNAVGGFSVWEPIFLYGEGWKVANDAKLLPDCVNHDPGNAHPCPKPLALMLWVIGLNSAKNILDPFAGSGTTLVAAKLLGRRSIGIEIEEKYCEIAANRLRQGVFEFTPPEPPCETQLELDAARV